MPCPSARQSTQRPMIRILLAIFLLDVTCRTEGFQAELLGSKEQLDVDLSASVREEAGRPEDHIGSQKAASAPSAATSTSSSSTGRVSSTLEALKRAAAKHGWHRSAFHSKAAESHDANWKPHKVEHVSMLKNQGFWWLMLVFVGLIAVVVVSLEVGDAPKAEASHSSETSGALSKRAGLHPGGCDAECPPPGEGGGGGGSCSAEPESCSIPRAMLAKCSALAGSLHFKGSVQGAASSSSFAWSAAAWNPAVWDMFVKLQVCVIGLNGSMLLWGIAQEFVMTNVYTDEQGQEEQLPSSLFLVLCNRLGSVFFSGLLLMMSGSSVAFEGFYWSALPAVSNLMASWCQYSALAHISFPLLTTAKSAKLLPVIAINALRNKKQTALDYAEGIVITCALVVFGLETDGQAKDATFYAQGIGVVLVGLFMLLDSLTPHLQDELFQQNKKLAVMQATFSMACFAALVCFAVLLFSGNLLASLAFLARHPEASLHIAVLSLCSTLTQFLISYTIKHFGPVTFAIIATTRQVISVCLSAVLFMHTIPSLASLAAAMVFGTVLMRALAKMPSLTQRGAADHALVVDGEDAGSIFPTWMCEMSRSSYWRLFVCAVAIHIPLCFWAVAQEFMFAHTFGGHLFPSVLVIIAMNRTFAVGLALIVLRCRSMPCFIPDMRLTLMPAATNLLATTCQYNALYFVRFPQQTMMKTLKVVPVMLCGRALKNRSYSWLDYLEASMLTGLVTFFVWGFDQGKEDLVTSTGMLPGLLLMVGYIVCDSLPSNLEDMIYQAAKLDPAQMLLGTELCAGAVTWALVLGIGDAAAAFRFLTLNPEAMLNLISLGLASACGSYACTVTLRFFSPAVFTLLMMSRQLFSLVISVYLFQHKVDSLACLCLIAVALLVLTSSMRQAVKHN